MATKITSLRLDEEHQMIADRLAQADYLWRDLTGYGRYEGEPMAIELTGDEAEDDLRLRAARPGKTTSDVLRAGLRALEMLTTPIDAHDDVWDGKRDDDFSTARRFQIWQRRCYAHIRLSDMDLSHDSVRSVRNERRRRRELGERLLAKDRVMAGSGEAVLRSSHDAEQIRAAGMTGKHQIERTMNVFDDIQAWLSHAKPPLVDIRKPEYRDNFAISRTLMHIEIGLKCIKGQELPDTDAARKKYGRDMGHRVHDLYRDTTDDVRDTVERHYQQFRTLLPNDWYWFETADDLLAECNKKAIILRYDESDEIRKCIEQGKGVLSHAGLIEILRAVRHCLMGFDHPTDIIGRFLLPSIFYQQRPPPLDGEFGKLITTRLNDDGGETWQFPSTLRLLDANARCYSGEDISDEERLMVRWLHESWNSSELHRGDPVAERILELSKTHFVGVEQDQITLTPARPND